MANDEKDLQLEAHNALWHSRRDYFHNHDKTKKLTTQDFHDGGFSLPDGSCHHIIDCYLCKEVKLCALLPCFCDKEQDCRCSYCEKCIHNVLDRAQQRYVEKRKENPKIQIINDIFNFPKGSYFCEVKCRYGCDKEKFCACIPCDCGNPTDIQPVCGDCFTRGFKEATEDMNEQNE